MSVKYICINIILLHSEPLYNMTQHPSVVSFRNQAHSHYISYMDQLTSLPEKVPTMANTYTSAIYGARQNMNTRLNSILGRDDVKYVRSYADPVVYQVCNSYTSVCMYVKIYTHSRKQSGMLNKLPLNRCKYAIMYITFNNSGVWICFKLNSNNWYCYKYIYILYINFIL